MGRVLVVGSSNTDLVARSERLPVSGETVRGESFATFAGGKGANQAVAAARAGAEVVFAGATGDDEFGEARRADLAADGIDISRLRVLPGVTSGVALIVVDVQGRNQIVAVPGANGLIGVDIAADAASHVEYDVLSLTLEIPFEAVRAAVENRRSTATAVLNVAPFDPRVAALIPAIDVLICNEIEAGDLLGSPVRPADAVDAATRIHRRGCRAVVITLGEAGAVVATGDRRWRVAAPKVDVSDTTGAGDAFCGTVAAWLAGGLPLDGAVVAGVASGSLAATKPGAQSSIPGRSEIEQMVTRMTGAPRR